MGPPSETQTASHAEIVRLAAPAMLALAADPLLSLVDTALVGRLGTVPLAALGINAAVFATMFWAFNFLTYGTTAEVARLRGAGDPSAAARYGLQALWLALGCGVAVTLFLLAAGPAILAGMGASGPVVDPAFAYLRVRAVAAVPSLVVAVGHGAFRGLKDTRTPLAVTAVANTVNALVSYVLIYPAGLGVVGAAYGTLVAQTGAAVAFLLLARGRRGFGSTRPQRLGIDPAGMSAIVRISHDLFLRTAALLGALVVSTAVAARMGATTVAGHQVARELWTLMTLVLDGFAIAAQAMTGTALGAGRPDVARADARRLLGWGLGAGLLIGAGYLAVTGPLPAVFTTDRAVLAEVRSVWWIVAVLQPVGGVVFVLDGVLMGAGDFRFLLWSTAAAALLGLVPVAAAALAFRWGLTGIWAGMAVLMGLRLLTTVGRLFHGGWAVSAPGGP